MECFQWHMYTFRNGGSFLSVSGIVCWGWETVEWSHPFAADYYSFKENFNIIFSSFLFSLYILTNKLFPLSNMSMYHAYVDLDISESNSHSIVTYLILIDDHFG